MISVCIPVYRYNATTLARELLGQVRKQALEQQVEILLYDDASPEDGDWGKPILRKLEGLSYVELPKNLGRAAIRNRMVRDAQGSYCLLLDADAELPEDYLARYLKYLDELPQNNDGNEAVNCVVVGGRRYAPDPPADPQLLLHWWYGHQRESDVTPPKDQGWLGFHSNNFLASRALLLAHPFPETVAGYGHEDTLWGQQFINTEISLTRLGNPVVHLGLEPSGVFLRKQQEAIRNLHRLSQQTPHLRTRLIDLVQQYPRLTALARVLPEKWLTNHLCHQQRPNLRVLDLLKLKWWWETAHQ